jgi:hypothetical protein
MVINKPKLIAPLSKLIYVTLILVFSSCSLQKRLYTKGFYSSSNSSVKKTTNADTTIISLNNLQHSTVNKRNKNSTLLTVNSTAKNTKFLSLPIKLIGACDTIVLRSGAKITANISEINPTQIKFKNCGSPNEPDIFINKDDINYITLANGTKEVFDSQKKYTTTNNFQQDNSYSQNYPPPQKPSRYERDKTRKSLNNKRINPFAVTGFIFGVSTYPEALILAFLFLLADGVASAFGGGITLGSGVTLGSVIPAVWFFIPLIFSFVGLACSIAAIYQINQNKENQKGLALAIIGTILSSLMIILVLTLYFISF